MRSPSESLSNSRRHYLLLAFAGLSVFAGMAAISLTRSSGLDLWLGLAIWTACALVGTALLNRYLPARDPVLFPLAIFLSGWGLVAIQRLAPSFADRQALWLVISVGAMLIAALLPHLLRWLRVYRYVVLAGALLLLLATIVFGSNPLRLRIRPPALAESRRRLFSAIRIHEGCSGRLHGQLSG